MSGQLRLQLTAVVWHQASVLQMMPTRILQVTRVRGDVLDGTDGFVVDTLAPAPVITIDPVTNAITIDFGGGDLMRLMAVRLRQMHLRDCWTLLTVH